MCKSDGTNKKLHKKMRSHRNIPSPDITLYQIVQESTLPVTVTVSMSKTRSNLDSFIGLSSLVNAALDVVAAAAKPAIQRTVAILVINIDAIATVRMTIVPSFGSVQWVTSQFPGLF